MSKINLDTSKNVSWLVHSIKDLQSCETRSALKVKFKEVEKDFLVLKENLFGRKKL